MKAVLIVEGLKDEDQIRKAFEGDEDVICLITEGTKMNNRIQAEIENYLREGIGVYILSDPDEGGEHLCQMIQYWYPEIPRLEADPKECAYFTGKKYKAGIEYASYGYLKELISPLIGKHFKRKKHPINWD
jgi:5S rRNA maturation endonuclease (ribonuclease M5)